MGQRCVCEAVKSSLEEWATSVQQVLENGIRVMSNNQQASDLVRRKHATTRKTGGRWKTKGLVNLRRHVNGGECNKALVGRWRLEVARESLASN